MKILEAVLEFLSMVVIAPWIGSLIWNWYFVPLYDLPRIEFVTAILLAVVVKQFSYVKPPEVG